MGEAVAQRESALGSAPSPTADAGVVKGAADRLPYDSVSSSFQSVSVDAQL